MLPISGQAQSRTAGPSIAPKTFFNGTTGHFRPDWQANVQVSSLTAVRQMREAPYFDQAQFDAEVPNLPYFDLSIRAVSASTATAAACCPKSRVNTPTTTWRKMPFS